MRDAQRDEEADVEAERSTAAILHRSEEAADRMEEMLKQSEELLQRLRSGR